MAGNTNTAREPEAPVATGAAAAPARSDSGPSAAVAAPARSDSGPSAAVAAAESVAPLAERLAAATERERALAPELVDAMRAAGLFSLCLPRALGGGEAAPAQMVLALERLARADAASAWCAMIGSTSSLLGGYLPPAEAARVYDGGRSITGGVFAPRGRARRVDGGYQVSGRWSFVSGVGHCDWVMGGCVVVDDGDASGAPDAAPETRLLLMPKDSVTVIDTWSVSGLCGTGSHDIAAEDVFVPGDLAPSPAREAPRADGALYAFPLFGLLALGIAAVALGTARGALDDLVALAGAKTPAASSRTLSQRPTVQGDVARAEARLRAARALMLEEAGAAYAAAERGGALSTEHRLGLRLAATHATRTAADVVDTAYDAGGGTSIYDTSTLQRRFRDVHVATQHMMVSPASFELAGRLLLGVPSDVSQL